MLEVTRSRRTGYKFRSCFINLRFVGFLFFPRRALPAAFIRANFSRPFLSAASCLAVGIFYLSKQNVGRIRLGLKKDLKNRV